MPPKLNIEHLRERFRKYGWELLEDEARGVMASYKAKCPCGEVTLKCPHTFPSRLRCRTCVNREKASNMRLTIEQVAIKFEEMGLRLLARNYRNTKTKLECICKCGRTAELTYEHVSNGGRCSGCMYERNGRLLMTYDQAAERMKELGMILLTPGEIRQRDKVIYTCVCGREGESIYANVINGARCVNCHIDKISGKNSIFYNPKLTRAHRTKYRVDVIATRWSTKVRERDLYKCQVCGFNKRTIAHHIYSYDAYPDKRTDITNGVTLCRKCHVSFHKHYGYGGNNKDQFMLFIMRKWGGDSK